MIKKNLSAPLHHCSVRKLLLAPLSVIPVSLFLLLPIYFLTRVGRTISATKRWLFWHFGEANTYLNKKEYIVQLYSQTQKRKKQLGEGQLGFIYFLHLFCKAWCLSMLSLCCLINSKRKTQVGSVFNPWN